MVLYNRVRHVFADGRIDQDERQELLWLLVDVRGERAGEQDSSEARSTRLPLTVPAPVLRFEGGGHLLRGALRDKNLTKMTDVLVIGSLASRLGHLVLGRKIEYPAALAEQGHPIAIVAEDHLSRWHRPPCGMQCAKPQYSSGSATLSRTCVPNILVRAGRRITQAASGPVLEFVGIRGYGYSARRDETRTRTMARRMLDIAYCVNVADEEAPPRRGAWRSGSEPAGGRASSADLTRSRADELAYAPRERVGLEWLRHERCPAGHEAVPAKHVLTMPRT